MTILVFTCYFIFGAVPIALRSYIQKNSTVRMHEVICASVVGLAGCLELAGAIKSLSSQMITQRRSIGAVLSAVCMGVTSVVLSGYIALNW